MGPWDWIVAQYLDDERWGILDANNQIIVGIGQQLPRETLAHIVDAHNRAVYRATRGQTPEGWQKRSGW